jgi:hypothetical protein
VPRRLGCCHAHDETGWRKACERSVKDYPDAFVGNDLPTQQNTRAFPERDVGPEVYRS